MDLVFAGVGVLLLGAGLLYIIVRSFEEGLLWGLLTLFGGPLLFVFVALHWDQSKAGALAMGAGLVVSLIGGSIA
ncbi:MAG: hypothetical protein AAF845_06330 [Bacteroidota bacterium]